MHYWLCCCTDILCILYFFQYCFSTKMSFTLQEKEMQIKAMKRKIRAAVFLSVVKYVAVTPLSDAE